MFNVSYFIIDIPSEEHESENGTNDNVEEDSYEGNSQYDEQL